MAKKMSLMYIYNNTPVCSKIYLTSKKIMLSYNEPSKLGKFKKSNEVH